MYNRKKRGNGMSENISDYLSIILLLSIPIGVLIVVVSRFLSKIQRKKKETVGKYYPEW